MPTWNDFDHHAVLTALSRGPSFADHDADASWDDLGVLVAALLRADTQLALTDPPTAHAPREAFNFWDEPVPPGDVATCLASWRATGLPVRTYDREAADEYIRDHFGGEVLAAFRYAHHPAMQSDIFRMARLQQEGGLYVDADDEFVGTATPPSFRAGAALIAQAVCRHCPVSLVPRAEDPVGDQAWYYLGNSPWFSEAGHPLVTFSLDRAIGAVMMRRRRGELAHIHRDVGPGCVSMAALDYLRNCLREGRPLDISAATGWPFVAQSRMLAYKSTDRNWRRNVVLYAQREASDRAGTEA